MYDMLIDKTTDEIYNILYVEELKLCYDRAKILYGEMIKQESGNFVNGFRINGVHFLNSQFSVIDNLLKNGDFDNFLDAFNSGYIIVKLCLDSEASKEDKLDVDFNCYDDKDEFLCNFNLFSFLFREAIVRNVRNAYSVYLDLLSRGYTNDDMLDENNLQFRYEIGVFMYVEDCTNGNTCEPLEVSYDELDEDIQKYYLMVFDELVRNILEIKKGRKKRPTFK